MDEGTHHAQLDQIRHSISAHLARSCGQFGILPPGSASHHGDYGCDQLSVFVLGESVSMLAVLHIFVCSSSSSMLSYANQLSSFRIILVCVCVWFSGIYAWIGVSSLLQGQDG